MKPSYRSARFTLRLLLLFVAMIATGLGLFSSRWFGQHRAVSAIRSAGGTVYYDYQFAWYFSRQAAGRQPAADWLRALLSDDFFHHVPFVDLRAARGVNLDLLTSISGLTVLVVDADQLAEDDLQLIGQLRGLEGVEIGGTPADLAFWDRRIRAVLPDCQVRPALEPISQRD
jgi:hypothetical protein